MQSVTVPVEKYEVKSKQVMVPYEDEETKYDVSYNTRLEDYLEIERRYEAKDDIVKKEVEVTKSKPGLEYFKEVARKEIKQEHKKNLRRQLN